MKCYVHSVPGRLRVKHPSFKNKTTHCEVQKALTGMEHGIATADFNTTTGSLLIHYDTRVINHLDILDRLKTAGFYHPEKTITNDIVINQATAKTCRLVTKAVSKVLLETALQGTALSFLTALL